MKLLRILLSAAIVAIASCQTTPLNPLETQGANRVLVLDERNNPVNEYQFRRGTVGYDLLRQQLSFIDDTTGQRVVIENQSWKILP